MFKFLWLVFVNMAQFLSPTNLKTTDTTLTIQLNDHVNHQTLHELISCCFVLFYCFAFTASKLLFPQNCMFVYVLLVIFNRSVSTPFSMCCPAFVFCGLVRGFGTGSRAVLSTEKC